MRQLREFLDRLGLMIADALDQWVIGLHSPLDVDGDAICRSCRLTEWPCVHFNQASDRIAQRKGGQS